MRIRLFAIISLLFLFSTTSAEAQIIIGGRARLLERENAELHRLVDSLMIQLDSLQSELAETPVPVEVDETVPRRIEIEYDSNVTDSLMNIWYLHGSLDETQEDIYALDSVRFDSNVPDSVFIDRLSKMNSYITLPFNETVKNYMILYTEKSRTKMCNILGLSTYYMPIIEEALSRYGLPDELKVMAIIESAFNPTAVSRAGATGMWQFMMKTAKSYGLKVNSFVDERMDVEKAADAAARYLRDSYKVFGDWCLAISSYNCGSGNVNKAIKRAGGRNDFWSIYPYLPRETRGYLPAFVGAMYALTYYKEYGLVPTPTELPAATDTFEIHRNLHFQQISDLTGVPMETLRQLNPQYIRDVIPGNEGTYILKLPYSFSNSFIDCQDSLYTHKSDELLSGKVIKSISAATNTAGATVYKVKNGDYLGRIASRYHVTVAQLKQWNGLRSDKLSIGQTLYIYGASPSAAKSDPAPAPKKSGPAPADSAKPGEYTTYVIQKGDTFYSIAKNYPGLSAQDIMDYNGMGSSLQIGMVIKIPNK